MKELQPGEVWVVAQVWPCWGRGGERHEKWAERHASFKAGFENVPVPSNLYSHCLWRLLYAVITVYVARAHALKFVKYANLHTLT